MIEISAQLGWYCVIKSQNRGNTIVEVYDSNDDLQSSLNFVSCAYVKGPKRWQAANFRTGTTDEQRRFVDALPHTIKSRWNARGLDVAEAFFDQRTLYIADLSGPEDNSVQDQQVMFVAERVDIQSEA